MAVFLSPIGNGAQYFTTGGLPLNGGFLNTYQAGTTTPQATFTTSAGNVANPVSIPLGTDGRPPAEIWLTDGVAYKFVLTDSLGNTIPNGTYDNISGIGSGISTSLAASSGASLIGWIQAGASAVLRLVQDKLRDTISVKDFGAVGDGSTDDYAAVMAAYNATAAGGSIYVPSGTYDFLTAPVFGTKRVSWVGDGARQSIFNYAGANTTNDCFTWGDGIGEVNGIRMSGIGFSSSTVMTGGAGVRFKLLSRSVLNDVLFSHQDGDSNFYHGAWFDGCDLATVDGFQARAQQDGIRVNGAPGSATVGARADLFLSNGKIGKCTVGLHVGGAFGGLYVDATDIIGNLTNLLIDKTINTFGNNRECMFGAFCALDGAGTSALPFSGINLDIQDSGGFIFFSSPWIASASTLIRIGTAFTGVLKLDGGFLYNAFNTAGGAGNGIEIGNTVAQVQVNGTRLKNINGTAFTCSAGLTTQTNIINPVFESDVTAKYNTNVRPLPQVVKGRFVAGGGDANFASAVDGNPAQTFYQGGNYGGATAIGFFGNNASGGWLEFSKSRGTTPGTQGIITSGDSIGGLNFSASDGVSFVSTASIKVVNTGTPAVGDIASRMLFATRPAGGSITDRVWILQSGNFAPVTTNAYDLGDTAGSLSWRNIYSQNAVTVTSDARTKTDIKDSALGLDFINSLRPVSYKAKVGSNEIVRQVYRDPEGNEVSETWSQWRDRNGNVIEPNPEISIPDDATLVTAVPAELITKVIDGKRTHWGFLAQEVKQAMDIAGVDFGGWVLSDLNNPDSQQALRYDQFIAPLIKAVQQLSARVQALEAR